MTTADLIITNGRVLTLDPGGPRSAEAVAVAGGHILAVGGKAEIAAYRTASTRIIDAQGGSVLPGFIESHIHIFTGASELEHLHLFGVRGIAALTEAVRSYAGAREGEPLLTAQGADYTILGGAALDRHVLDRIVPGQPFMMVSPDHHTAWANTVALERAGILHGRRTSPGHEVVMGLDGLATGELREPEAFGPVAALQSSGVRARLGLTTGGEPENVTEADRAYDLGVMKRGLAHCARHGITSFQNMDGNFYQLELLDALRESGELTCRGRVPFHFVPSMPISALERASEMARRYQSDWLASGIVKLFMDGVLESWTAVMHEDYPDRPGWRGEPRFDAGRFAATATEADRRGLQIAVHAIGDGAVNRVLNGYEAARSTNGPRDSRHRVEHIELVLWDDIPRFRALGAVASMQPPHPPGQMGLPLEPTLTRIGPARWPRAYAWTAFRDAGVPLVFSSDWPVSPIDPITSIQSAMTREPWAPGLPDNRQTLGQALAAYTRDAAWVAFAEHRKGRLTPGFLADIVVLSGDLEATAPDALHEIRPAATICGGRVTFET
jgi:predicted amidohydrolase YtcJ